MSKKLKMIERLEQVKSEFKLEDQKGVINSIENAIEKVYELSFLQIEKQIKKYKKPEFIVGFKSLEDKKQYFVKSTFGSYQVEISSRDLLPFEYDENGLIEIDQYEYNKHRTEIGLERMNIHYSDNPCIKHLINNNKQ